MNKKDFKAGTGAVYNVLQALEGVEGFKQRFDENRKTPEKVLS